MGRRPAQCGQSDLPKVGRSYIEAETTTENTLPPLKSPPHRFSKEEDKLLEMMIKIWNDTVQVNHPISNTKVRLTDSRSVKLMELFRGYLNSDLEEWSCYCQKIANSQYLMGKGDGNFVAGLDWAIQPSNALKTLEGAIYDKPAVAQKQLELSVSDFDQELEKHCQEISAPSGWLMVCKKIAGVLGQHSLRNWLRELNPVDVSGSIILLEVKTRFVKDFISSSFRVDLERVLREVYPESQTFEISVSGPEMKEG
jgi:hypothetical protein